MQAGDFAVLTPHIRAIISESPPLLLASYPGVSRLCLCYKPSAVPTCGSTSQQARAIFEAAAEVGRSAKKTPVAEVMVPLVSTLEAAVLFKRNVLQTLLRSFHLPKKRALALEAMQP